MRSGLLTAALVTGMLSAAVTPAGALVGSDGTGEPAFTNPAARTIWSHAQATPQPRAAAVLPTVAGIKGFSKAGGGTKAEEAALGGPVPRAVRRGAAGMSLTSGSGARFDAAAFTTNPKAARRLVQAWGKGGGATVQVGQLAYSKTAPSGGGSQAAIVFAQGGVVGAVRFTSPSGVSARTLAVTQAVATAMAARASGASRRSASDQVLARFPDSGPPPKRLALQLFASIYGPLPGVRTPAGDRTGGEPETAAIGAVLRYWPTLSAAQRRVIAKRLGFSQRASSARGTRARAANWELGLYAEDVTSKWAATVKRYVAYYQRQLHGQLTKPLPVKVYEDDLPSNVSMDATPVGRYGTFLPDKPAVCRVRVRVNESIANTDMAHEIFHCVEFVLDHHWNADPPWIIEGLAEWGRSHFEPSRFYPDYQKVHDEPINKVSYAANGFWSRAEELNGDPFMWANLKRLLEAGDDPARFAIVKADQDAFLDTWPSASFAEHPPAGAWQQMKPAPARPENRGPVYVAITDDTDLDSPPYARTFMDVSPVKEVIHVTVTRGRVRAEGDGTDFGLPSDDFYCAGEKCECPDGRPARIPFPHPLNGDLLHLAATGGTGTARAHVHQMTLDEWQKTYCPPREAGIVTGTFTETWTYHQQLTEYDVEDFSQHITVSVRMSYDDYDPLTVSFIGLQDAGTTVTADSSASSNNDPPGCSYSKKSSLASYSGPVHDASIGPGGVDDRTIGSPEINVTGTGEDKSDAQFADVFQPFICSDPPISDTSTTAPAFQTAPVISAPVAYDAHTATYDYTGGQIDGAGGIRKAQGTISWGPVKAG